MAFSLSTTFCQNNNCKDLNIIDTSNWDSTVQVSDVTTATIEIGVLDGTTTTVNVLSTLLTALTGTISITTGSATVTGTLTTFVSELEVGDLVSIDGNDYTVHSIESNTSLTLKELALTTTVAPLIGYLIDKTFVLDSNDISGTTTAVSLTDGIYYILYTIIANGTTYTFETYQMLYCQADCCITNSLKILASTYTCNSCNTSAFNDLLLAFALKEGLKSSSCCGSSTELANILSTIQQLCQFSNNGCNC